MQVSQGLLPEAQASGSLEERVRCLRSCRTVGAESCRRKSAVKKFSRFEGGDVVPWYLLSMDVPKDRFKQRLGMHRHFAKLCFTSFEAAPLGHGGRLEAGSAVDDELAKMKGKKACAVTFTSIENTVATSDELSKLGSGLD